VVKNLYASLVVHFPCREGLQMSLSSSWDMTIGICRILFAASPEKTLFQDELFWSTRSCTLLGRGWTMTGRVRWSCMRSQSSCQGSVHMSGVGRLGVWGMRHPGWWGLTAWGARWAGTRTCSNEI
jgi:hypothetical protein